MFLTRARRLERLQRSFDELCELLDDVGETEWVGWAKRCRSALTEPSPRIYRQVLSVYGGMGSFNDFVLQPLGGYQDDASRMNSENAALERLRSRIYTDARILLFPQRRDRTRT